MKATDYTPDQIMSAISKALASHDMPAVVDLVGLLAIISPHDAEAIVDAMKVGRLINEANR